MTVGSTMFGNHSGQADSRPIPLFDEGLPPHEAAPGVVSALHRAALHLIAARRGLHPDQNRLAAQEAAQGAATELQRHAGLRISRPAMLGIVAELVEVVAGALDPSANL